MLNIGIVLVTTLVMFAVGAVWYTLFFQKAWGRIHGFDKLSKAEQKQLMSGMGATYAAQLLVTLISAYVLTHIITVYPDQEYYLMAFWLWLGFVMPSQVSAVLFSNTPRKYQLQQILIMSGEALVRLLVAAWVIHLLV